MDGVFLGMLLAYCSALILYSDDKIDLCSRKSKFNTFLLACTKNSPPKKARGEMSALVPGSEAGLEDFKQRN